MPRGVPRVVREDGTTWCSKGHHWVHLTGFYLKGVKYLAWNPDHSEKIWYGKPTNSWCKDCIAGRTPGSLAEDHGEPGAIDWDRLAPEEQAKLIQEFRKDDKNPYANVAEAQPSPSGYYSEDGEYQYPDDPEERHQDALRRLTQGLINVTEYERVMDM